MVTVYREPIITQRAKLDSSAARVTIATSIALVIATTTLPPAKFVGRELPVPPKDARNARDWNYQNMVPLLLQQAAATVGERALWPNPAAPLRKAGETTTNVSPITAPFPYAQQHDWPTPTKLRGPSDTLFINTVPVNTPVVTTQPSVQVDFSLPSAPRRTVNDTQFVNNLPVLLATQPFLSTQIDGSTPKFTPRDAIDSQFPNTVPLLPQQLGVQLDWSLPKLRPRVVSDFAFPNQVPINTPAVVTTTGVQLDWSLPQLPPRLVKDTNVVNVLPVLIATQPLLTSQGDYVLPQAPRRMVNDTQFVNELPGIIASQPALSTQLDFSTPKPPLPLAKDSQFINQVPVNVPPVVVPQSTQLDWSLPTRLALRVSETAPPNVAPIYAPPPPLATVGLQFDFSLPKLPKWRTSIDFFYINRAPFIAPRPVDDIGWAPQPGRRELARRRAALALLLASL